jgi:flavin-dependent dehydrogenase
MDIAIIGAGVTGSYLASRLSNKYNVKVFEQYPKDKHFPVCAWGTSRYMLSNFCSNVGLNFDEYILHGGKHLDIYIKDTDMHIQLKLDGLVTYDKRRWEQDMLKDVDVEYGKRCTIDNFPLHKYDCVLDCTGFHRSMLPKPREDLVIPAWEYMVEYDSYSKEMPTVSDDFYTIGYKGAKGYFWFFPLGSNRAFVGAGDLDKKYYGVEEFMKNTNAKVIMKIGRPIRLAPPTRAEPIAVSVGRTGIIGVGESVGTVFPLLGEGIIPSLLSADIFYECMMNGKDVYYEYTEMIKKQFKYYDAVYQILKAKMEGRFSFKDYKLLFSVYRNMKREEKRFGFEVSWNKMLTLINSL